MAPLDDFESTLKEVVQAKRLSASKMGKLTEIALRSMEKDTQLVSALYRTHKSLPPAAKVSSLYVFDALSRAARHQVTKQGLTGDVNSEKGNAATFLSKIEGVLEGLFQDMITVGSPEAKEKTKKILDIWVKGCTFPSAILSRLTEVVRETDKVPEVPKPVITIDPRTVNQPVATGSTPPIPTKSATPVLDPQAALMALLAQAASAASAPSSGQTPPNIGASSIGPPLLDATQLAVLQQLAQTASGVTPSHSVPPLGVLPSTSFPSVTGSQPRSPPPHRDEVHNSSRKNSRYDRFGSPDRGRFEDHVDDRSSSRGGFRGGFRGRGRGDGRSRWDDRDHDRYRDDRERSPPRRRRSRSKSPPSRYGGRRDVRPYSPPRKSLAIPTLQDRKHNAIPLPSKGGIEKDEFGRDIRPPSPDTPAAPKIHDNTTPPAPPSPVRKPSVESTPALPINHERMSISPLNTSSSTPSASFVSNTISSHHPGMESFDLATFDFTSAPSWEALGKMWQVSYGYMPSTEQLMQFVMAGGQVPPSAQQIPGQGIPGQGMGAPASSGQTWRGRGRGGFSRGRGGFGHGQARNTQADWARDDGSHETDAIVLGGGESSSDGLEAVMEDDSMNGFTHESEGGSGGRMQRQGDKWVFVQDPSTEVS